MEKTKKFSLVFTNMKKRLKCKIFRNVSILALLFLSVIIMFMIDKENALRDNSFAFLSIGFVLAIPEKIGFVFNPAIGAWKIILCLLFIATVFFVGTIFSNKVTKTINKKFPNSNAEEGHGHTIAKTGFNFILLIFCCFAILIALISGLFNNMGIVSDNPAKESIISILVILCSFVALAILFAIIWFIVEVIIFLCKKPKEEAVEEVLQVQEEADPSPAVTEVVEETAEEIQPVVEETTIEEQPVIENTSEEDEVFSISMFGDRRSITKKSFSAKLCQVEDITKEYYSEIKNYLLSYKKVNSRTGFSYDSFNLGRPNIAKLALKGKTLVLYLALKYEDYAGSKYHPKDASDIKKYENTPMYVKIKSTRAVKFAKELIDIVMGDAPKKTNPDNISYVVPYKSDEQLLSEGLIKIIEKK